MIKAIFFDVDGTMLSHTTFQVSNSTKSAIEKLRQNNIKCILATGRHILEIDELPLEDIKVDGYITLNGQLCLDENRRVVYGNPIVGLDKEFILKLFEEKTFPTMLIEKDKMYMNYVDACVEQAQKDISTAIPEIGRYIGNDIYQAVVYMEKGKETIFDSKLPTSKIVRWNDNAIDIIPGSGGKVLGIEEYMQKNNITQQETMAFGDADNDIDMLRFAHIGVAMGNAKEHVKECADYVTTSVDEEGIEKALKHFEIID